jgi:hypothetical protein
MKTNLILLDFLCVLRVSAVYFYRRLNMEQFSGLLWLIIAIPLFLIVFFTILIYELAYRRPKFLNRMAQFTQALGMNPVAVSDFKRLRQQGYDWYTGSYKGHQAALKPVIHNRSHSVYLLVAISVNVSSPQDIKLFRERQRRGNPRKFKRAFPRFGQKNIDRMCKVSQHPRCHAIEWGRSWFMGAT